jgi:hypothetical protein
MILPGRSASNTARAGLAVILALILSGWVWQYYCQSSNTFRAGLAVILPGRVWSRVGLAVIL